MSVRTLETRLETMSVQDENDLGDGTRLYTKTKVRAVSTAKTLTSPLGDDINFGFR